MVKMVSLFGRLGNKTNDIKFFKQYLPRDNKIIVEPFGGTFALTRLEYNDNKYKKYVNDTDEKLTKIYNDPLKYYGLYLALNDIAKTCLDDDNKHVKCKLFLEKADKYVHDNKIDKDLYEYWKECRISCGVCVKTLKNTNCDEFINIMKNVNFTNNDWEEEMNKYKNNKDAFIFLDPPYLFSNNKHYADQNKDGDNTDMLYKIYEIMNDKKTKSKIMLIINDMKILRWLFKNYIKGDYGKIYQLGKRKDKHLIICNYDI